MHLGKQLSLIPFDKIYRGMNVGAVVDGTDVTGKVIQVYARTNSVNIVEIEFSGSPDKFIYDHKTLDWCHYMETAAN